MARILENSQRNPVTATGLFLLNSDQEYYIPHIFTSISSFPILPSVLAFLVTSFILSFYLFMFRPRGRVGEREGEKHQYVVASHVPPIGDLARNPGMCPDWELNQRPFGLQASTQSTDPHQPGLVTSFELSFSSSILILTNISFTLSFLFLIVAQARLVLLRFTALHFTDTVF